MNLKGKPEEFAEGIVKINLDDGTSRVLTEQRYHDYLVKFGADQEGLAEAISRHQQPVDYDPVATAAYELQQTGDNAPASKNK